MLSRSYKTIFSNKELIVIFYYKILFEKDQNIYVCQLSIDGKYF